MKIIKDYSKRTIWLLINWAVGGSLVYLAIVLVSTIALQWHKLYIRAIPASWVFEYHSVEPVQPSFEHYETIRMRTSADWYREADVVWTDTLRCPPISFVSQAQSWWHKLAGDDGRREWLYGKETPMLDSTCFMESTITATIEHGVTKTQTVFSAPFLIH